MSLLFDQIRARLTELIDDPRAIGVTLYGDRKRLSLKGNMQEYLAMLGQSQVVVASNVAKYFYEIIDQEHFGAEDFPNLAPPFPFTWIEFVHPDFIHSRECGDSLWDTELRPDRWAIWITSVDPNDYWAKRKDDILLTDEKPKWFLRCMLFHRMRGYEVLPVPYCTWELPISETGMLQQNRNGDYGVGYSLTGVDFDKVGKEHYQEAMYGMQPLMNCGMMALTFMHCKNVVSSTVHPKERHSKIHRQKHGVPLVSYKVLEIEPMRRVLRTEGGSDTTGIKQSMHICRGHFKHFTPDKPLFGKVVGTFWWDSMVRGTVESGLITKQYKIKEMKQHD